ncbi:MAG: ROK family transcriptional regulator [Rikenellaceae bacterium]|jgi:predicted NBD/HSP70 family sugar kinase|nr:ROK family transcriptional regulator [Rikenellaceae bacterium]
MNSMKYYLTEVEKSTFKGVVQKNLQAKRDIIKFMVVNGSCTLSHLSDQLNMSIPTVTKLVAQLQADGIVVDNGKNETSGGRRPNLYGLAESTIYFVGVDVKHRSINFALTDLNNKVIDMKREKRFELVNTPECLEEIIGLINEYVENLPLDKEKIMGVGISLPGRINSASGYSYYYFNWTRKPLSEFLGEQIGFQVLIENETRASCYAEYQSGNWEGVKNAIYFYLSYGLAVGISIDGKLYYGKSGFAGELGHTPMYDNEILCQCGKKGCLETEVSGLALERQMRERLKEGHSSLLSEQYNQGEQITMKDILNAAAQDDVLSIELIEQMGEKAGRAIATLINIFNPELLIIGGRISKAGDYFLLPAKSAVNKHSLSLVNKDSEFVVSRLGDEAELIGVAMLIRKRILEI